MLTRSNNEVYTMVLCDIAESSDADLPLDMADSFGPEKTTIRIFCNLILLYVPKISGSNRMN